MCRINCEITRRLHSENPSTQNASTMDFKDYYLEEMKIMAYQNYTNDVIKSYGVIKSMIKWDLISNVCMVI